MAPATTRFVDVWDAFDAMRRIVETKAYEQIDPTRADVTDDVDVDVTREVAGLKAPATWR